MDKQDIIRMAREAGLDPDLWNFTDAFERFAALVAATAVEQERKEFAVHAIDIARKAIEERDKFWQNHMEPQIEIEVAREREACAKVCDDLIAWNMDDPGSSAAKAIRARSGENK
jgi:hypothetical protein